MADIGTYLNAASSILVSGQMILEDPALPAVVSRVKVLHDLEAQQLQRQAAKTGQTATAPAGIGLRYAIKPLDYVIWYRKNPWSAYAALALAIGIPFMLGYAAGRKRRR